MRCILCLNLSLEGICRKCETRLLKPTIFKREIAGVTIYSFFPYNEIESLILTKHTDLGMKIYKKIARAITPAIKRLINEEISLVPIEGYSLNPYSHTALLVKEIGKSRINCFSGVLIDSSGLKYSGKPLNYRITNPRKFSLKQTRNLTKNIALIDDIVTTGTTIKCAKNRLRLDGFETKVAFTLADAKNRSV